MAKVIRDFKERFHDYKKYNVGDDYPETDKDRVKYLVQKGFLEGAEDNVEESELDPDTLTQKAGKRRKKGVTNDGDTDA